MAKSSATRIGKLPPRYSFFLNPYQDMRFTTCPKCRGKTKLRKLPLIIHVDPLHLISLNKTCRFCPYCELLIAHQDELEHELVIAFETRAPEMIGNDYLVLGTLERPQWKRGMEGTLTMESMLQAMHDFKKVLTFKLTYQTPLKPGKTRKS